MMDERLTVKMLRRLRFFRRLLPVTLLDPTRVAFPLLRDDASLDERSDAASDSGTSRENSCDDPSSDPFPFSAFTSMQDKAAQVRRRAARKLWRMI